jgi:(p)ppGpp synthase/HD superfamily hydrolase
MTEKSAILERIKEYADRAHGDQMRKYVNDRYIVHPIRVMKTCLLYSDDIAVHGAALLHDVLEDTPITKDELFAFLVTVLNVDDATRTLKLVEELTDIYTKENFPGVNRRNRKLSEAERLSNVSPDAQTIKYADIIDNADITYNDPNFAQVYLRECGQLLALMDAGNEELRDKAIQRLQECKKLLKSIKNVTS